MQSAAEGRGRGGAEAGGEPGRTGGLRGLLRARVMEGKARWLKQNQQGGRQGQEEAGQDRRGSETLNRLLGTPTQFG